MSICPISAATIDQRCAQGTALLVMLLSLAGSATALFPVTLFLSCDFLCRGFGKPRNSLLALVARQLVRAARIPPRPVNAGPKVFAAKIGFLFCLLILTAEIFSFHDAGLFLAWMLALCAALEGFFSVCVGCYLYTLVTQSTTE